MIEAYSVDHYGSGFVERAGGGGSIQISRNLNSRGGRIKVDDGDESRVQGCLRTVRQLENRCASLTVTVSGNSNVCVSWVNSVFSVQMSNQTPKSLVAQCR